PQIEDARPQIEDARPQIEDARPQIEDARPQIEDALTPYPPLPLWWARGGADGRLVADA
ncbi:MAG: hypothetical protein HGB28_05505, partial [Oscillochloris sp.]|nr:hypothetical protein [Oscillochloris sp.]